MAASGATEPALALYADAIRLFPRNVPLTISYAETLIAAGKPAEAHELLLDLLNNVPADGAAAAPDRARRERRRRRRERLLLHVVLLRRDRQPAARDRPGAHGARDARAATTSIERDSRSRLDQLIEYLPDEQRDLATTDGSQ